MRLSLWTLCCLALANPGLSAQEISGPIKTSTVRSQMVAGVGGAPPVGRLVGGEVYLLPPAEGVAAGRVLTEEGLEDLWATAGWRAELPPVDFETQMVVYRTDPLIELDARPAPIVEIHEAEDVVRLVSLVFVRQKGPDDEAGPVLLTVLPRRSKRVEFWPGTYDWAIPCAVFAGARETFEAVDGE